jgi:hypothetical protein
VEIHIFRPGRMTPGRVLFLPRARYRAQGSYAQKGKAQLAVARCYAASYLVDALNWIVAILHFIRTMPSARNRAPREMPW